ncbi:MAG TPA: hypothetical protein IAC70_03675 [Candidatus Faecicola pullistercoris]|nr:hypothetical protein [Candidatus Faecicola pullistercoris]
MKSNLFKKVLVVLLALVLLVSVAACGDGNGDDKDNDQGGGGSKPPVKPGGDDDDEEEEESYTSAQFFQDLWASANTTIGSEAVDVDKNVLIGADIDVNVSLGETTLPISLSVAAFIDRVTETGANTAVKLGVAISEIDMEIYFLLNDATNIYGKIGATSDTAKPLIKVPVELMNGEEVFNNTWAKIINDFIESEEILNKDNPDAKVHTILDLVESIVKDFGANYDLDKTLTAVLGAFGLDLNKLEINGQTIKEVLASVLSIEIEGDISFLAILTALGKPGMLATPVKTSDGKTLTQEIIGTQSSTVGGLLKNMLPGMINGLDKTHNSLGSLISTMGLEIGLVRESAQTGSAMEELFINVTLYGNPRLTVIDSGLIQSVEANISISNLVIKNVNDTTANSLFGLNTADAKPATANLVGEVSIDEGMLTLDLPKAEVKVSQKGADGKPATDAAGNILYTEEVLASYDAPQTNFRGKYTLEGNLTDISFTNEGYKLDGEITLTFPDNSKIVGTAVTDSDTKVTTLALKVDPGMARIATNYALVLASKIIDEMGEEATAKQVAALIGDAALEESVTVNVFQIVSDAITEALTPPATGAADTAGDAAQPEEPNPLLDKIVVKVINVVTKNISNVGDKGLKLEIADVGATIDSIVGEGWLSKVMTAEEKAKMDADMAAIVGDSSIGSTVEAMLSGASISISLTDKGFAASYTKGGKTASIKLNIAFGQDAQL